MVGGGGSSIFIDETLTERGKAADAKAVGNRLSALSEEIGSGLSEKASNLLISILRNGLYSSDQSANITALAAELGVVESGGGDTPDEPVVTLTSISATYGGGDVAVGTAVTDLTGIVVTANYSDGSSATVTGYTLDGTIAEGENTITVIYQGKSTTFTVNGIAESTGENNGWTDGDPYTDMVTWQDGYTINATTGVAEEDTTFSITDYLPCKGVDAFSSTNNNTYTIYLYDDNKNYIGKRNVLKTGVYASSYLTSDGQTPAYFRTIYRTTWKDQGQWQPFITPHELPVATPTTVLEAGNYYIPVFKAGYTVWNNTGVETEKETDYCTDFIFIKDFASISISTPDTSNRKWIGFYDAEKNYINGGAGNLVTNAVPENAYYCRIACDAFPGIRWWIMPNAGEGV